MSARLLRAVSWGTWEQTAADVHDVRKGEMGGANKLLLRVVASEVSCSNASPPRLGRSCRPDELATPREVSGIERQCGWEKRYEVV